MRRGEEEREASKRDGAGAKLSALCSSQVNRDSRLAMSTAQANDALPICPVQKLAWWCCTLFRLKRSSVHRKRGKILFSLTPPLVCVSSTVARGKDFLFFFFPPSRFRSLSLSLFLLFFFYFCSSSKGYFLIPIFLPVFVVVYAKVMRKTGKSDTRDRMARIACKQHFQIPTEIFVRS